MSVESRPVVRAHRRWRMTLEGCNTYLYSTLRVYVVNSRVSACTRDFSIIMKKKIYIYIYTYYIYTIHYF